MLNQWLAVAERIAVALERMAEAAEHPPADSWMDLTLPRDLRGLSNREVREEYERRDAAGYFKGVTNAR